MVAYFPNFQCNMKQFGLLISEIKGLDKNSFEKMSTEKYMENLTFCWRKILKINDENCRSKQATLVVCFLRDYINGRLAH